MLPENYKVAIGDRLIDLLDNNRQFTVLCSCAGSRPRRHTRNYVAQKRHEFMTLADWQEAQAHAMRQDDSAERAVLALKGATHQPIQ